VKKALESRRFVYFFKAAEKSKGFSVLYVIIGGIQMSLFMIVAEDGG
jgi:hypothetical protein